MVFNPTTFNITTLLLAALTLFVLYTRYRVRHETNNWPLFYYVALVAFAEKFEARLSSTVIYSAIVSGLLLRFEFLSGWMQKAICYLESAALVYIFIRCLQMIFFGG